MSDSEPNIVEQCLESLACADHSITGDRALLVQTSIAVSLKRIADAVCGDDKSNGIHEIIWQMANRTNFS